MKTSEIMTSDPACCKEDQSLQDAATLMVENDCGQIPVVDDEGGLVGVITDRDVCCRAIAEGMSAETRVGDVMTRSVVSVTPDTSLEDCLASMEKNQVRRVPVIDDDGKCCGMVSQADVARTGSDAKTAELVQEVSQSRADGKSSGCCYGGDMQQPLLEGSGCRLHRTEVEHLPATKSRALPWTSVSF